MIETRTFHRFEDLAPFRGALTELSHLSRRRCPFETLEYLEAYAANDEFYLPGELEPWLVVGFEEGRPVGYAALRRVWQRALGRASPKLEFLATHDTDRPHVVARPEDEPRVVRAIYEHLLAQRDDWSFLELQQQDASSTLWPPPQGLALSHLYLRPYEAMSNNVIPVEWPDLAGYLDALDKKFRGNVKRQVRGLLAEGPVSYVSSSDPVALPVLFELYLALERRSWKARAGGTIGRHPRRIAFFRALMDPRMPMRLTVNLAMLEGVPVAGSILAGYAGRLHAMQVIFDDALARLSPGTTLFLMAIKQAIDERCEYLNLMSGFSYYKTKWLAQTNVTATAQFFRIGSRPFYRAIAGDLRRSLERRLGLASAAELDHNEARRRLQDEAVEDDEEPPPPPERRFVEARLAALAGRAVRVYSPAELEAALPFETRRTPPPKARTARGA